MYKISSKTNFYDEKEKDDEDSAENKNQKAKIKDE